MAFKQSIGFNDWLSESLNNNYGRLANWKKNGSVVVFIHTNSGLHRRMIHEYIPIVKIGKDDRGHEIEKIGPLNFVCHEPIDNYFRKDSPIEHCPIEHMIEQIRNDDSIDGDETVWEASIGDRKTDRFYTKNDLLQVAGKSDWRNNMRPSLQYVFGVIDVEHPEQGIVVAAEKFSLGEAIKKAIRTEVDRRGDVGNPHVNPYAFKFVFDSKARKKTDFYNAYPWEKAELTEDIKELLDSDPIDLSNWLAPGDTSKLRAAMERHLRVEVDLDRAFANVLPNAGSFDRSEEEEEEEEVATPVTYDVRDTKSQVANAPKKTEEKKTPASSIVMKTERQHFAILAIAKTIGLDEDGINTITQEMFVKNNDELTNTEASKLIERLQYMAVSNASAAKEKEAPVSTNAKSKPTQKTEAAKPTQKTEAAKPTQKTEATTKEEDDSEQSPCPLCKGTGKHRKGVCPACNGSGLEPSDDDNDDDNDDDDDDTEETATCGKCNKEVPIDSTSCPFCLAKFSDE